MALIGVPNQLQGGAGGAGGGGATRNPYSNAFNRGSNGGRVSRFGKGKNQLTRYYGYSDGSAYADPYTTGYGLVVFENIPEGIIKDAASAAEFLTGIAETINVPSYTINVIEYEGLNNMSWGVPGNATIDSKTFTVRMVEFKDAPLIQLIGRWVNALRDINFGISTLNSYTQSEYKATVTYVSTDPTGNYVMSAFKFTGVFPTRVPYDALSLDINTQDKVIPEIEFHFDQMFVGDKVMEAANAKMQTVWADSLEFLTKAYGR